MCAWQMPYHQIIKVVHSVEGFPAGNKVSEKCYFGKHTSVFNQTNIGTVLRATLGWLLRDRAEHV